jgi:photosystem II stability/assembly factor-like uncharacterized protein
MRELKLIVLVLLAFTVFLASVAIAGVNEWTSIGPYTSDYTRTNGIGLPCEDLVVDPDTPTTLYAGTDQGLFKSTDGGGTWYETIANFLSRPDNIVLVIDPSTPTTLYAGACSEGSGICGVYKSTDGGSTWNETTTGLPSNRHVTDLVIDPSTPTTLYAGIDIISSFVGGIYKSIDGGESWSDASTGLPPYYRSNYVSSLAIDPDTPATLYAGINNMGGGVVAGVFKSTDGGSTWSEMNTGLTSQAVYTLAIDPLPPPHSMPEHSGEFLSTKLSPPMIAVLPSAAEAVAEVAADSLIP